MPAELAGPPSEPDKVETAAGGQPPQPPRVPLDPVSDRAFRLGGLAALALALGLGMLRLPANDIWYDEAASLFFARFRGLTFFGALLREDTHGPVYYGLLGLWTRAFGESMWVARLPSVLCAAGTVYVVAQLGARLFGRSLGLLAALFVALSPFHLFYAQEVRFHTFIEFLGALNLLCFLQLTEGTARTTTVPAPTTSWPWWGFVATGAACVLTFYLSGLLLVAEAIRVPLLWRRIPRRRVLSAFAALAAIGAAWLPAMIWQVRHTHGSIAWIPEQPTGRFLWHTGLTFTAGKGATWFDKVSTAVLASAAGMTLLRAVRNVGQRTLACWFAIPVLAILLISLRHPLYEARYFFMVLPAFFLLATAGLGSLRRPWLRVPLLVAVLAALLISDVRYFSHLKFGERWNDAAAFVRREAMPNDVLVAVPAHERCILTHYFPDFRHVLGANYLFHVNSALLRGSRLWLFTHRDEDRFLPGRITPNALPLDSRDFGTLRVSSFLPLR